MDTWRVKMCTYKDLCALYGVSYRIIKNQLKPFLKQIGPRNGNFFTVNQVIVIVEMLGPPSEVDVIFPAGYKGDRDKK
jgi:hypothetical protein